MKKAIIFLSLVVSFVWLYFIFNLLDDNSSVNYWWKGKESGLYMVLHYIFIILLIIYIVLLGLKSYNLKRFQLSTMMSYTIVTALIILTIPYLWSFFREAYYTGTLDVVKYRLILSALFTTTSIYSFRLLRGTTTNQD
jgi:hypothetical protein